MPWGVAAAAVGAAGAIGSSIISSNAAQSAADTQSQAANNATQTQLQMFNTVQGNLAPWVGSGQTSANVLNSFLGIGGGQSAGNFSGAGTSSFQYNPANDPLYNFMLSQGSQAITNQASALGGVNSGSTLRALSDYGQQTALSSYQNEFNNWNTTLNNIYSRILGVNELGQNAAAGVGTSAVSTGQEIGNNMIGAGNARAAGTVGAANAFSGGLQSIFSNPNLSQMWSNSNPGSGAGGLIGGQNALNFANSTNDPIGSLASTQGW